MLFNIVYEDAERVEAACPQCDRIEVFNLDPEDKYRERDELLEDIADEWPFTHECDGETSVDAAIRRTRAMIQRVERLRRHYKQAVQDGVDLPDHVHAFFATNG
jgi:hypothetical protein